MIIKYGFDLFILKNDCWFLYISMIVVRYEKYSYNLLEFPIKYYLYYISEHFWGVWIVDRSRKNYLTDFYYALHEYNRAYYET